MNTAETTSNSQERSLCTPGSTPAKSADDRPFATGPRAARFREQIKYNRMVQQAEKTGNLANLPCRETPRELVAHEGEAAASAMSFSTSAF